MKKTTKTHLAHGIEKTVNEAAYDDSIKALLVNKQVLARIAQNRINEFRNYDIPTIIECIEGDPEVSTRRVYPGKDRAEAITGMNSESKERNEGELTFDIRFFMRTRDEERIKVIVNIEAQKSYYPGYNFEPRAIVYCARMISEQIDREFTTDDYDGLKKVYSIWIFFNAPEKDSDTITEYTLEKKDVYGKPVVGGKYDYLSISFIRLPKSDIEESKNKLINMLSVLFSETMDAETKKKILEQKYEMKMTRELEGGISSMCNVGEGLVERTLERGIQQVIGSLIKTARKYGAGDEEIVEQLMEEFQMDKTVAEEHLKKLESNI